MNNAKERPIPAPDGITVVGVTGRFDGEVVSRQIAPTLLALSVLVVAFFLVRTVENRSMMMAIVTVVASSAFFMRVGTFKRFLLGLCLLEVPIGIDIYFGFDPIVAQTNAISGYFVSLSTFALAALYAFWLLEKRQSTVHGRVDRSLAPMLVAYPTLIALSVLYATNRELALNEVVIVVQGLLLAVYIIHIVKRRSDVLFVVAMIAIGPIFQGVLAIGAFGPLANVNLNRIRDLLTPNGRTVGSFGSPNVLGGYLTLVIPVAVSLLVATSSRVLKLTAALSSSLGLVALVLSQSRGAWVGATISITVLLIMLHRRRLLAPVLVLGIALGFVAVLIGFGALVLTRIQSPDNGAAVSRIALMDLAFSVIAERPITGVGANNFAVSLGPYLTPDFTGSWVSTVHNKYLLVWAEAGILGLLAWVWMVLASVRTGFATWKRRLEGLGTLSLGLALGVVGVMIHAFGEIYHGRPDVHMLYIVIGLILAINRIEDHPALSATSLWQTDGTTRNRV